jgi:hypothetical protein
LTDVHKFKDKIAYLFSKYITKDTRSTTLNTNKWYLSSPIIFHLIKPKPVTGTVGLCWTVMASFHRRSHHGLFASNMVVEGGRVMQKFCEEDDHSCLMHFFFLYNYFQFVILLRLLFPHIQFIILIPATMLLLFVMTVYCPNTPFHITASVLQRYFFFFITSVFLPKQ